MTSTLLAVSLAISVAGQVYDDSPPDVREVGDGLAATVTGYEGLKWGTSEKDVKKKYPDLVATPRDAGGGMMLARQFKVGSYMARAQFNFDTGGLRSVSVSIPVPNHVQGELLSLSRDKQLANQYATKATCAYVESLLTSKYGDLTTTMKVDKDKIFMITEGAKNANNILSLSCVGAVVLVSHFDRKHLDKKTADDASGL